MRPAIVKKPLTFIQDFLRTEASGGIILMFVALIALIWSNSPAAHLYDEILHVHIAFSIGDWLEIDKSMVHWINDGLMAIFFLLVGLEIKR